MSNLTNYTWPQHKRCRAHFSQALLLLQKNPNTYNTLGLFGEKGKVEVAAARRKFLVLKRIKAQ
jgi:hypothetical protein